MDNDDAMVGSIWTRRQALALVARGGFAVAAATLLRGSAFGGAASSTQPKLPLLASPALTEGPFFVDEKLNRSDLLTGTTRPSVANGLPLMLQISVCKMNGKDYAPLANAQVDLWHADAHGVYSDEDNPMNSENTANQKWLRGYQLTDAAGLVAFSTIVPGWYEGRTPHIHFKIRQLANEGKATAEFTSQLFFSDADLKRIYAKAPYNVHGVPDSTNKDDNIFSERQSDGSTAGSHLTLDLKPKGAGLAAEFAIVLTDKSMHAGGRDHGPGGPPPGGRRDGPRW